VSGVYVSFILNVILGTVLVVMAWLLDLQLPLQSVDTATKVVSSYPVQARYTRYNIIHLCIYKYYVFPSPNQQIPPIQFELTVGCPIGWKTSKK
jgi:hypothetical protein